MEKKQDDNHHHILSDKVSLQVLICLLIFTIVTVFASRMNFGALNFPIAIFIASVKALLVTLFFMGLKYDDNENRVIFFSSIFFLVVFFLLTASDVFTRNVNWRATGPLLKEISAEAKFRKPWLSSDELKAYGKGVFQTNCVTCHGAGGAGDGVAGGSLNPKPRNLTQEAGWKNGRKPTDVFLTLKNGVPGSAMASYEGTLTGEDRWALTHYVLSLGPTAPEPTAEDYKRVGVNDSTKDDGGMGAAAAPSRKIPIDFAMERYLLKAK